MKKYLKFFIPIVLLVLFIPKAVFADMISHNPQYDLYNSFLIIGPVWVLIDIMIFLLAFYCKLEEKRYMKKRETSKAVQAGETKEKLFSAGFYLMIPFALIMILFLSELTRGDFKIGWILAILTIASLITNFLDYKKIARILLFTVILTLLISMIATIMHEKNVEKFNEQFFAFSKLRNYSNHTTEPLFELIDKAKEVNKGRRKIIIRYNNNDYITSEGLDNLKNIVENVFSEDDDTKHYYRIDYFFDKNHDYMTVVQIFD